jgi:putative hydrolase of the HAD superfamily
MMVRNFRAVLFDVENVIAYPDEALLAERLARLDPSLTPGRLQTTRDEPELYVLWDRYSVGAMSSADYWRAIAEGLGLAPDAGDALAQAYAESAWAYRDPAVLAVVSALRATGRFRLGLLSNSAPDHDAHAAAFEGLFDVAIFSHRVGRRKPNAEAYRAAADVLGVDPSAVVFIDDKPRNTRAAEAEGMTGIVFTSASALVDELNALGLLGTPVPHEAAE